ncbi:MAG: hypothetical protein WCG97_02605 [bacterium]
MKKIIIGAVMTLASFLPLATFASTFAYVDVNGNLGSVDAANANQALTVSNIAYNSGVVLLGGSVTMSGLISSPQSSVGTYQYVDVSGKISAVQANSPEQALTVSNIASNSGVVLVR